MSFGITITIQGINEVLRRFHILEERMKHMRPLMENIGRYMSNSTKQRFSSKEGPGGDAWADNTYVTIERYKGRDDAGVDSGGLRSSITYDAGDTEVRIHGSDHGKYMQFGFYNKRHKSQVRPREYLGISEANKTRIETLCRQYILNG